MSRTKAEIEAEEIAASLLMVDGSAMDNLTFLARDLGFPDHSAIHDAAKEIIAKWVAWVVLADRRDRALQAKEPPSAGGVKAPPGWKLVPVEPTVEMEVAATEAWLCESALEDRSAAIYRSMLAASPLPGRGDEAARP